MLANAHFSFLDNGTFLLIFSLHNSQTIEVEVLMAYLIKNYIIQTTKLYSTTKTTKDILLILII